MSTSYAMEKNGRDRDTQSIDIDGGSKRSRWAACHGRYTVVTAILVRLLLLAHTALAVWVVVSLRKQNILAALLSINVLLLIETLYTVIKHRGRESKWFCPCFLAYLCAVLPPIWLVELHRLSDFSDKLGLQNATALSLQIDGETGLTVPIKLEANVWVAITEQTLLFLLVLCRWFLPRGDLTRQELSQLLFVFMGIASDNMELFELFDETDVRKDTIMTYIILGVWSLSLMQFIFVLTATRNPRKLRAVGTTPMANTDVANKAVRVKKKSLLELIFATEIWALTFSVLVQDGPYAGVRIYAIVKYNLITYSIIFFVCKNLLIVCLVFYRLAVLCVIKLSESDDDDDDDDNGSDVSANERVSRSRGLLTRRGNGRRVEPEPMPMGRLDNGMPAVG